MMNKLNSLKIVLTILLAVLSMQQVSAKYWFRLQVEAKCKDSEGNIRNDIGFIAVKFSTQPTEATKRSDLAQSHTGSGADWLGRYLTANVYMLAKGDGNWQFDHWELEDGTTLSNSNQETGTASHTYRSTNRCPSTSSSGDHEHAAYYTEHTYYAVFREVITQVVFAEAYPETLGEIKYQKENSIGDEITLRTYTLDYHNKFLGWVKQGDEDNILTTDRVLTFTITDETKGTYIAKYDNGYNFVRFKNFGTGRYMDFTSDEGSLQNLESLQLKDAYSNVVSEAGSVIEIAEGLVKGSSGSKHTYYDYYMQNAKTSKFYDFDPTSVDPVSPDGIYIRMPHDVDINVDTWALSTDDNLQSGYRIGDQNGAAHAYMGKRNEADWYIEPMDKDLETKENYFSLDPNKLVEVGGKYYTTLRTSWNILFNPEQMTPYVVTEVDEENGTFDMEPITGNIIPAGTPVIIETKSKVVLENRMVPTTTAAASDAVPSGNWLKVSTKYFPNQNAPVDNCKGLIKNANGQLAFGGNALSTVNGNEAYLGVANEVVHDVQPVLTETTLANLLKYGEIGPNYKITDLTCVYIQGNTLYCKDDNNALNKSVIVEGEEDYIKTYTALQDGDWDQSNWIAINLPEGSSIGTDYMEAIFDHRLNNVVGHLKSKVNPEFEATLMPTADEENPYNENTYITCNFSGVHQQGVVNGKKVNLFFVAPKPMEIAQVEWAMWDAASEMFIMPHAADDSGLHGAFLPNFSMLENVEVPDPQDGYSYHFPALIKLTETSPQGSAPILAAGNSSTWTVYPLEWNTDTHTAIDNLQAGKTVTSVVYYNMMGVASDKPHQGINIVETRYSDGSRTVEKVMK